MTLALPLASSALACAAALAAPAQQLVVPSGQTFVYDTASGPLVATTVRIEAGGVLRVVGAAEFRMDVARKLLVDGTIDLSGFDAADVLTLNTGNQPEVGARGAAGGGQGGTASSLTTTSTPRGGNGQGAYATQNRGGRGGEAGFGVGPTPTHRPGGGGGGALGPDRLVDPDPLAEINVGRWAQNGQDGGAQATGALSGLTPPQGGAAAGRAFVDADPLNDFWGTKRDPLTGALTVGELDRPLPGRGGGAGGDAVPSAAFPSTPWNAGSDLKGAGGGGGGGLGIITAREVVFGPEGEILADGGDGGGGENTIFLDRVGGGSGGGSGGWLVVQARVVDLRLAGDTAISALGGRGGPGMFDVANDVNAGGNGGPGVVQIHVPAGSSARVLLAPGKTLADVTAPEAHVLLQENL